MPNISKINELILPSATMEITAKARELRASGKPVIGFGAGEPDFPTPSYIIDAAKQASENPVYHKYSQVNGLPSLREEISRTAKEYSGYEVTPENVLVTNGGKQAIITSFMSVLDKEDEVVIPKPYWTTYPEAVKIAGGKPVYVESNLESDYKITRSQLDEVKTNRTKILVWVSPSNPTGVVYTPEEAKDIYEWAFENDIWILSDELYEHLVYEGDPTPSPAIFDSELNNTIIINGVSKAYSMTGWRVGWLIGNSKLINIAKKIQSHSVSNVSNISQVAAEAALKNGLNETLKMKEAFNRRRLFAIDIFTKIQLIKSNSPQGAFYIYPDVSEITDGKVIKGVNSSYDLCNWLLEELNIAFVPGEAFGTPGFIRCSYALGDDDLKEGLSRLHDSLSRIQ
ncbi:MAG: pyridoxal phosphate-dependent aminotransferase [Actinomycetota bacterium]|nr:pyridoxal phosphate-dependent aminotransferase [Actinomycetota bacterium]|tara:strand:+ start:2442 stop:3635 length:1194 start_codon:yes stop_codon:yes gene_type:complete